MAITSANAGARELAHEAVLRDGAHVWVRPIRPDDAERLIALHSRLSRATTYQRFFTAIDRLPGEWATLLASVDYDRRFALVAEPVGPGDRPVVAVARWEPCARPDAAELAMVIEDAWQGRGLGTMLLHDLARAADTRGIRRFVASVLADNRRMLMLLARHMEIEDRHIEGGVFQLVCARRAAHSCAGDAARPSAPPGEGSS